MIDPLETLHIITKFDGNVVSTVDILLSFVSADESTEQAYWPRCIG